jgi:hypothetical protein
MGTLQGGCGLCFTPEAFQGRGIVEHFGRQEFQTHGAMEPSVLGLVDHTPSAAQLFRDVVGRNGLANK